MDKLHFRPHHFLCTLCFQGAGYSEAFVRNYQHIVDNLTDETPIHITPHTDSICEPCPNKQGKLCATQKTIDILDKQHAQVLQWKSNEVMTWGQAKEVIKQQLTLEKFHAMCTPCGWKDYGICEKVLGEFLTHEGQS